MLRILDSAASNAAITIQILRKGIAGDNPPHRKFPREQPHRLVRRRRRCNGAHRCPEIRASRSIAAHRGGYPYNAPSTYDRSGGSARVPPAVPGRIERSHPSGIKDLSTTGGIKRRPVQNHSRVLAGRRRRENFDYISFEVVQERIGVIEAICHRRTVEFLFHCRERRNRREKQHSATSAVNSSVWSDNSADRTRSWRLRR